MGRGAEAAPSTARAAARCRGAPVCSHNMICAFMSDPKPWDNWCCCRSSLAAQADADAAAACRRQDPKTVMRYGGRLAKRLRVQ